MGYRILVSSKCYLFAACILLILGTTSLILRNALPGVLKDDLREQLKESILVSLEKGSTAKWQEHQGLTWPFLEQRERYSIHLFNVSNLQKVYRGLESPIVTETGPLVFDVVSSKVNNTMSGPNAAFRTRKKMVLNRTLSADLSQNITQPNLPYLHLLSQLKKTNNSETLLAALFAGETMDALRAKLEGPFLAEKLSEDLSAFLSAVQNKIDLDSVPYVADSLSAAHRSADIPKRLTWLFGNLRRDSLFEWLKRSMQTLGAYRLPSALTDVVDHVQTTMVPTTLENLRADIRGGNAAPQLLSAAFRTALLHALPLHLSSVWKEARLRYTPSVLCSIWNDLAWSRLSHVLAYAYESLIRFKAKGDFPISMMVDLWEQWRKGTKSGFLENLDPHLYDKPTGSPRRGFELPALPEGEVPTENAANILWRKSSGFSFLDSERGYPAWRRAAGGDSAAVDEIARGMSGIDSITGEVIVLLTKPQIRAVADWLYSWRYNPIIARDLETQWRLSNLTAFDLHSSLPGVQLGFELPRWLITVPAIRDSVAAALWNPSCDVSFTTVRGFQQWRRVLELLPWLENHQDIAHAANKSSDIRSIASGAMECAATLMEANRANDAVEQPLMVPLQVVHVALWLQAFQDNPVLHRSIAEGWASPVVSGPPEWNGTNASEVLLCTPYNSSTLQSQLELQTCILEPPLDVNVFFPETQYGFELALPLLEMGSDSINVSLADNSSAFRPIVSLDDAMLVWNASSPVSFLSEAGNTLWRCAWEDCESLPREKAFESLRAAFEHPQELLLYLQWWAKNGDVWRRTVHHWRSAKCSADISRAHLSTVPVLPENLNVPLPCRVPHAETPLDASSDVFAFCPATWSEVTAGGTQIVFPELPDEYATSDDVSPAVIDALLSFGEKESAGLLYDAENAGAWEIVTDQKIVRHVYSCVPVSLAVGWNITHSSDVYRMDIALDPNSMFSIAGQYRFRITFGDTTLFFDPVSHNTDVEILQTKINQAMEAHSGLASACVVSLEAETVKGERSVLFSCPLLHMQFLMEVDFDGMIGATTNFALIANYSISNSTEYATFYQVSETREEEQVRYSPCHAWPQFAGSCQSEFLFGFEVDSPAEISWEVAAALWDSKTLLTNWDIEERIRKDEPPVVASSFLHSDGSELWRSLDAAISDGADPAPAIADLQSGFLPLNVSPATILAIAEWLRPFFGKASTSSFPSSVEAELSHPSAGLSTDPTTDMLVDIWRHSRHESLLKLATIPAIFRSEMLRRNNTIIVGLELFAAPSGFIHSFVGKALWDPENSASFLNVDCPCSRNCGWWLWYRLVEQTEDASEIRESIRAKIGEGLLLEDDVIDAVAAWLKPWIDNPLVLKTVLLQWSEGVAGTLDVDETVCNTQVGYELSNALDDPLSEPIPIETSYRLWNASFSSSFLHKDGFQEWQRVLSGDGDAASRLQSALSTSTEQFDAIVAYLRWWSLHLKVSTMVIDCWRGDVLLCNTHTPSNVSHIVDAFDMTVVPPSFRSSGSFPTSRKIVPPVVDVVESQGYTGVWKGKMRKNGADLISRESAAALWNPSHRFSLLRTEPGNVFEEFDPTAFENASLSGLEAWVSIGRNAEIRSTQPEAQLLRNVIWNGSFTSFPDARPPSSTVHLEEKHGMLCDSDAQLCRRPLVYNDSLVLEMAESLNMTVVQVEAVAAWLSDVLDCQDLVDDLLEQWVGTTGDGWERDAAPNALLGSWIDLSWYLPDEYRSLHTAVGAVRGWEVGPLLQAHAADASESDSAAKLLFQGGFPRESSSKLLRRLWTRSDPISFLHEDGFALWRSVYSGIAPYLSSVDGTGVLVGANETALAYLMAGVPVNSSFVETPSSELTIIKEWLCAPLDSSDMANTTLVFVTGATRSVSSLPVEGSAGSVTWIVNATAAAERSCAEASGQAVWSASEISTTRVSDVEVVREEKRVASDAVTGLSLLRETRRSRIFSVSPDPASPTMTELQVRAIAKWVLGWANHPLVWTWHLKEWSEGKPSMVEFPLDNVTSSFQNHLWGACYFSSLVTGADTAQLQFDNPAVNSTTQVRRTLLWSPMSSAKCGSGVGGCGVNGYGSLSELECPMQAKEEEQAPWSLRSPALSEKDACAVVALWGRHPSASCQNVSMLHDRGWLLWRDALSEKRYSRANSSLLLLLSNLETNCGCGVKNASLVHSILDWLDVWREEALVKTYTARHWLLHEGLSIPLSQPIWRPSRSIGALESVPNAPDGIARSSALEPLYHNGQSVRSVASSPARFLLSEEKPVSVLNGALGQHVWRHMYSDQCVWLGDDALCSSVAHEETIALGVGLSTGEDGLACLWKQEGKDAALNWLSSSFQRDSVPMHSLQQINSSLLHYVAVMEGLSSPHAAELEFDKVADWLVDWLNHPLFRWSFVQRVKMCGERVSAVDGAVMCGPADPDADWSNVYARLLSLDTLLSFDSIGIDLNDTNGKDWLIEEELNLYPHAFRYNDGSGRVDKDWNLLAVMQWTTGAVTKALEGKKGLSSPTRSYLFWCPIALTVLTVPILPMHSPVEISQVCSGIDAMHASPEESSPMAIPPPCLSSIQSSHNTSEMLPLLNMTLSKRLFDVLTDNSVVSGGGTLGAVNSLRSMPVFGGTCASTDQDWGNVSFVLDAFSKRSCSDPLPACEHRLERGLPAVVKNMTRGSIATLVLLSQPFSTLGDCQTMTFILLDTFQSSVPSGCFKHTPTGGYWTRAFFSFAPCADGSCYEDAEAAVVQLQDMQVYVRYISSMYGLFPLTNGNSGLFTAYSLENIGVDGVLDPMVLFTQEQSGNAGGDHRFRLMESDLLSSAEIHNVGGLGRAEALCGRLLCDKEAYSGSQFPPALLNASGGLSSANVWSNALGGYRSYGWHNETAFHFGIPTRRFSLKDWPEESAICNDTAAEFYSFPFADVFHIMGFPSSVTPPHFASLGTTVEALQQAVHVDRSVSWRHCISEAQKEAVGLGAPMCFNVTEGTHRSFFDVEPKTGSVLHWQEAWQLNVEIVPDRMWSLLVPSSKAVPYLRVVHSSTVLPAAAEAFKANVHRREIVIDRSPMLLLVAGLALLAGSAFLIFRSVHAMKVARVAIVVPQRKMVSYQSVREGAQVFRKILNARGLATGKG